MRQGAGVKDRSSRVHACLESPPAPSSTHAKKFWGVTHISPAATEGHTSNTKDTLDGRSARRSDAPEIHPPRRAPSGRGTRAPALAAAEAEGAAAPEEVVQRGLLLRALHVRDQSWLPLDFKQPPATPARYAASRKGWYHRSAPQRWSSQRSRSPQGRHITHESLVALNLWRPP